MPELSCAARRVGDLESRAFEINAALDSAVEAARAAISDANPGLRGPTDEALSKLAWRTIQSAKYERGERVTSRLQF
jgi:hypothetical protein